MSQLDSVRDSEPLRASLHGTTPIVDRAHGSRGVRAGAFLKWLRQRARDAGIVRVADISWLAENGSPVFQATRPALHSHAFLGQNSGSQGRGTHATLAEVSALMEAMEMHCAEPRNAMLIRNSYGFLVRTHPVIPLDAYVPAGCEPPSRDEPFVWTAALSLEREVDVLVPAEAAFYALNARDFGTRPIVPASSNGLAGGASLIEATLHGLYELVERYYFACCESGDARVAQERLLARDVAALPGHDALLEADPDTEIGVFAIGFRDLKSQVAMAVTVLSSRTNVYWGSSCHHDAYTAILRSWSEATQGKATRFSAAREDMAFDRLVPGSRPLPPPGALRNIPESLGVKELCRRYTNHAPRTLQQELAALVAHIHALGFPHVLIKNLTRVGLEVPVVRAIVPGMAMQSCCYPRPWSLKEVIACQYCLDL
jgi:ribosomal protein S12 methylthiotransferase accessory factor